MNTTERKKYWFEMYLQQFFLDRNYNYLMVYVNQDFAEEIIKAICNDILGSTKKTSKEKEAIKKKCISDLKDIIKILTNDPLDKEEYNRNIKYAQEREISCAYTKEKHTKHIRNISHINGESKKYDITLLALSFILVEIYYKNFFKKEIYENYKRFKKSDIKPLKVSFEIAHGGKLNKEEFKSLKNSRLNTVQDYYKHLTLNIDLWWSITWEMIEILDSNSKYYEEVTQKKWIKPSEKKFDELKNLLKNHYFMYHIYPIYYENKIMEEFEIKKKSYQKELRRICSKNFKCEINEKNIQTNVKTRKLILENFDDMLENINNTIASFEQLTLSNILTTILVDPSVYKENKQ